MYLNISDHYFSKCKHNVQVNVMKKKPNSTHLLAGILQIVFKCKIRQKSIVRNSKLLPKDLFHTIHLNFKNRIE